MTNKTDFAALIAEIAEEFELDEDEIVVSGGGRGWTASVDGLASSGKAESKGMALALLRNGLQEVVNRDEADGPQDGEEMECSEECQTSTSNYCQCKCDGAMHGAALGVVREERPVAIGEKPCKCGCGQTTKRIFVPGHDARFHAEVELKVWALSQNPALPVETAEDLEAARKAKKAAVRKVARERRAAQRAEVAAKAEAIAKTVAPKQSKRTRKGQSDTPTTKAVQEAIGDLPF